LKKKRALSARIEERGALLALIENRQKIELMKLTGLFLITLLLVASSSAVKAQSSNAQSPDSAKAPAQPPVHDNEAELRKAIESSRGSEQELVENLEGYLKKYPNSQQRDDIERELYKIAAKLRDRARTITYAEKLLEADPNDIEILTSIITYLRERRGDGDLPKALSYANQLIEAVENIYVRGKSARISVAQWEDRKARSLASVYLVRGRAQADLSNDDKALLDLQKSWNLAPISATAALLAELAEKRKAADEAMSWYAQAFALTLSERATSDRLEIRKKLGRLYAAKNGSEAGLGDLLLKAYDAQIRAEEARQARITPGNINEGATEPFQYKLTKLDGTIVKLSDYRGKVIFINFWATWCGPCRAEAPLLEKTMAKYSEDKDVIFLALTTDEDRSLVEPFIKEQKSKLPVYFAEGLDEYFGVESIPTTIIMNREGKVTYRMAGFPSGADFVQMMSDKIESAKKKS
jgi:thiol-disulfide isomerase/thioredoxin